MTVSNTIATWGLANAAAYTVAVCYCSGWLLAGLSS